MDRINYHPYAPAIRANPYPAYVQLRREAPIYKVASLGFWVISRYADVRFVLQNPAMFSSCINAASPVAMAGIGQRPLQPEETLLGSDPPQHTRLRRIVHHGFTPQRIAALEPRIRAITDALIEQLVPRGECDLMAELAIPLPVTVMGELLGIAPEHRDDFKRWSHAIMVSTARPEPGKSPAMAQHMEEFQAFFRQVIAERRRQPGADLISVLVHAEDTESALTLAQVLSFSAMLLIAGHETTTNVIGNALLALLRNPSELAKVRSHLVSVPAVVEETLRYDAPVQLVRRQAMHDVTLGGVTIPAKALVMPCLGSANRDEEQFHAPDRFDVERNSQGHLAFGFGPHLCVGAALARLEAKIALEAVLSRFSALALVPERERDTLSESPFVRGPKHLFVTFEPT